MLQNTRGRQVDTHDSWICCGSVSSGAGRKQTPVKNGLFENLLEKLAIRKSSMVCIVKMLNVVLSNHKGFKASCLIKKHQIGNTISACNV